jgi:hypothetical protein
MIIIKIITGGFPDVAAKKMSLEMKFGLHFSALRDEKAPSHLSTPLPATILIYCRMRHALPKTQNALGREIHITNNRYE